MNGDYSAYVLGAYAIAVAGVLALTLWALLDRRAARDTLARAERVSRAESADDE